ncbi:MAG: hypothetical protein Q8N46_01220, partial [Anaerolineales bacterium]|nr:hypothetical protein [Anaerolineales bacterium]
HLCDSLCPLIFSDEEKGHRRIAFCACERPFFISKYEKTALANPGGCADTDRGGGSFVGSAANPEPVPA